jgi:hypothetical protein
VLAPGFFQTDIGHAYDLAPVDIDDLLIEKIALDAQHVFIGVIRVELFVRELDAVQRDGCNLVVTNGEPRRPRAHEITINAGRMNQRHQSGIADTADEALLQVIDRKAEEVREVEEILRHVVLSARTRVDAGYGEEAKTPD